MKRKLILRNSYSAGDIVMLTAAVRDLHRCHPGRFQTDVQTSCAELWLHNPHLTVLSEADPDVEIIECTYPLINRANVEPYHCLHGFMAFLSERLGVHVAPTAFHGDIHLSAQEQAWYSQVRELAGRDIPFWVVAAGGKHDVPIKWWASDRFQEVIDAFRGRIQFVQVGDWAHHHPRLDGVIDLRGRTNLRELVRLVYHAQGVLCPVTALMHLAAAVPRKPGAVGLRPCVVVAGGREPAHWESYPGHRFLHTVGALDCCSNGGCWKDRVVPLGDGRDRREDRCVDVVDRLPRCMHMLTPSRVVASIGDYFAGGRLEELTSTEKQAAAKAQERSQNNPFDRQPLHLSSLRLACDSFLRSLPPKPPSFAGRGVVMCAGGVKYFTCAYVCIRLLRWLGCRLPIQVWHLGNEGFDRPMRAILRALGAECVNAKLVQRTHPARRLGGWGLKAYALVHSPFEEILFLDADNIPVADPSALFETPEYTRTGAVFWPDYRRDPKAQPLWRSLGAPRPREAEFESGQILVDKRRCWRALKLSLWLNEQSDLVYRHVHGDKETFHLAFCKLRTPYALVPHPIHPLTGTMCQHWFDGRRVFQHRNTDKWSLFPINRRVRGFVHEGRCRRFLRELNGMWDARLATMGLRPTPPAIHLQSPPSVFAVMISCPQRDRVRRRTLCDLARTDWGQEPFVVMLEEGGLSLPRSQDRITLTSLRALEHGLASGAEYILFLEDDLQFNHRLRHNLEGWPLLRQRALVLGSLYNPGLRAVAWDVGGRAAVVEPQHVFGSQALLLRRDFAQFTFSHWNEARGMQDLRISRLAGRHGSPIYYHVPSLVQHVGRRSTWGGFYHQARDYRRNWACPDSNAAAG